MWNTRRWRWYGCESPAGSSLPITQDSTVPEVLAENAQISRAVSAVVDLLGFVLLALLLPKRLPGRSRRRAIVTPAPLRGGRNHPLPPHLRSAGHPVGVLVLAALWLLVEHHVFIFLRRAGRGNQLQDHAGNSGAGLDPGRHARGCARRPAQGAAHPASGDCGSHARCLAGRPGRRYLSAVLLRLGRRHSRLPGVPREAWAANRIVVGHGSLRGMPAERLAR